MIMMHCKIERLIQIAQDMGSNFSYEIVQTAFKTQSSHIKYLHTFNTSSF